MTTVAGSTQALCKLVRDICRSWSRSYRRLPSYSSLGDLLGTPFRYEAACLMFALNPISSFAEQLLYLYTLFCIPPHLASARAGRLSTVSEVWHWRASSMASFQDISK